MLRETDIRRQQASLIWCVAEGRVETPPTVGKARDDLTWNMNLSVACLHYLVEQVVQVRCRVGYPRLVFGRLDIQHPVTDVFRPETWVSDLDLAATLLSLQRQHVPLREHLHIKVIRAVVQQVLDGFRVDIFRL